MSDADLHEDYRQAGFGNRLGFGARPALVVVDFCRAYLDPASPLYAAAEPAMAACGELLAGARAAGVPVLHTRVEYEPGGANGGVWFRKVPALACFERGNPLADWPAELAPRPGETVVTKQYASGFFGTSLASTLVARQVDTVLIAGVSTSGCVRATALDALQHGFVPVVVRDAVGDRDTRVHDANLFDLAAKYADVVPLDETLSHLRSLC
ncbi:MAG: isochorismatase family protein [Acidimicrobiia bacterium]|nr:isochorismatase family protein [Acidimicrobiia bacterium]